MKKQSGFTLIETIIYIALFAVIMSSGLLAVNQLLQGAVQTNGKATVQDEERFVLRKIDWALSGASSTASSLSTLTVTRYDGNTVDFRLNGTMIEMRESAIGATYIPLTTANVKATALKFTSLTPAGITATMTINGYDATTTKYMRK